MLTGRAMTVLLFSFLIAYTGCSDSIDSGQESSGGSGGDPSQGGASNQGGASAAGGSGEAGSPPSPTVTLSAAGNLVALGVCGANPATASDLPAGTYTIRLEASTLSKGTVDTEPRLPSMDNYVVVHLPFSQSTSTEERFLMLNGVGAQYSFTLDQPGSVEAFFVDSDSEANHGTATLSVTPGDRVITVDAAANVIGWRALCQAEPARLWVDAGQHELTLESSSLSSAAGREDDYVLVRLPSEFPEDDYRYVILNGVGSKFVVDAAESEWVRAWFISSNTDASGEATLRVGRQQLAQ